MFRFDPALSVTNTTSLTRERRGFALEATLVVMVLVGAIVALTTAWVLTTQRTTGIDYRAARVQHAAEAGADGPRFRKDPYARDPALLARYFGEGESKLAELARD